ncbi:hypothetical protein CEP51_009072 [Fusarium floridanum]|uniref:Uncharacterized protein n=1 Tax=Fusarium floridanum TaxID=1325733 RepID=A0A428RIV8_9HYPO|nr:hypothetical protein CEP51_009072 [Fusarium floridanum]
MRPKTDRQGAESEPDEQLPVVQGSGTLSTTIPTERFIQRVDAHLERAVNRLQGEFMGALAELDRRFEGIAYETAPECRGEVQRASMTMQQFTRQCVTAVAERAIATLQSDFQFFQDTLIEMDAELGDKHTQAMEKLQGKLEETQRTGAVPGERTPKPPADRVGRGASAISSGTGNSSGFTRGFEELFSDARDGRSTGQGSRRPPKPKARASFKYSQRQRKNHSSKWDRGGRVEDSIDENIEGSIDSAEIESESTPKSELPLEPKEPRSTYYERMSPKEPELSDYEHMLPEESKPSGYEHLDPMMRSLLEAGEDLHREFKKDASKAGTEEWKGDTKESAELRQQLNYAVQQFNQQKTEVNRKTQLIEGLQDQIVNLTASNQSLKANLESMTQASSASAAGTPTPGQFGRIKPVTSFPFNSAGGSPRVNNNLAWINSWLPKAARLQMERIQLAVRRCNAEETSCSEKMSKLGDDKQAARERDCLSTRKRSSEVHRQDFRQTMAFLEELSRHSKKSQSCLADELSGLELGSAASVPDSDATPRKLLTPEPSDDSTLTPTSALGKKPVFESGPQGRDASTSPKEPASPPKTTSSVGEPHGESNPPKEQGTTPKAPSPLAESHTAPASNTTPTSNAAPSEGRNRQVRELDDPESATQAMVGAIDSGVLGVWSFFAYLGLVAMTHAGAWVRVCKFIYRVFTYSMSQMGRAIRLIWPFTRDSVEGSPGPNFPQRPSPECFIIVMYHCVVLMTFQVYMACQRERAIWFEANGLTRKYMLESSRVQRSWLFFGVDGDLVVGRKDIEDLFKMAYVFGVNIWQHLSQPISPNLSRWAYGTHGIDVESE